MKACLSVGLAAFFSYFALGQIPQDAKTTAPAEHSRNSPASRNAVQWLLQPVVAAEFNEKPLFEVFRWLSELTGQPVVVRWSVLHESGIEKDTPVSVSVSEKPLWKVIWVVTNSIAAPGGERLAFEASKEGFLFSTHSDLSRNFVTATYDVEAWLQPDVDFIPEKDPFGREYTLPFFGVDFSDPRAFMPKTPGQRPRLPRTTQWNQPESGPGSDRVPPGAKKVSGNHWEVQHHTEVKRVRATAQPGQSQPRTEVVEPFGKRSGVEPAMHDLLELILNTIEPESWEINGLGGRATIAPFRNKQIIVRNSVFVHQLIGGYLQDRESISEARALNARANDPPAAPQASGPQNSSPTTQAVAAGRNGAGSTSEKSAGKIVEKAEPAALPKAGDAVAWLDAVCDDAKFDEMPLENVLEWVGKKTGTMIVVRWSTLEDLGIRRDTPITVDARGRKLWRLLWAVSNQVKDKAGDALAYEAAGDSFLFSSHGDLTKEMVTKTYKVADWLHEEADFSMEYDPKHGDFVPVEKRMHTKVKRLKPLLPPTTAGGPSVQPASPIAEISHPHEDLMDLLELILNGVEPDSWEFNGQGGRGTIFPYKRDKLIIRNSLYVHQLVGGFLSDRDAVRELKRDAAKRASAK